MANQVQQSGAPVLLAASGQVSLAAGTLLGFYVNSTTGGTVVIENGTASSKTAISGTITPAIGFHPFPAYCTAGCYATIANTTSITFFFAAG